MHPHRQLWRPRHAPPPPKASLDDAEVIPLAYVSIFSKLTFTWVTPIMEKGYQRPLQATDLWKMDPSREAGYLSQKFIDSLRKRQETAATWNANLATIRAPWRKRMVWSFMALLPYSSLDGQDPKRKQQPRLYAEKRKALEEEWRTVSGRRSGSVTWALNDVMVGFWAGGLFKVVADTAQLMAPLITKALIRFSQEVYAARANGTHQPNVGRGIGMAFGLWALVITQSVCQHQFFFRSMAIGALSRATLMSAVFTQSLSLSVEARVHHPQGHIMSLLNSDISRIDYCAQWFHAIWTAPIQLLVCLILLLVQIGPSALVGFSLFILIAPLQTWFMKMSFNLRKKSMLWTDGRAKLLRELLSSMQIIKVFTYEIPFLKKLWFIRRRELVGIRKILIIRAANQAMAFSIPTLAAVLSFVTYASTHSSFDPALIFTSLALFNLLRQPLMFLPRALSTFTDAQNAMERLTVLFEAELGTEDIEIDPTLDVAIRVDDATFAWAAPPPVEEDKKSTKANAGPVASESSEPFCLPHLSFEIPRGQLVGIVGPVGSGKSSILQALIGDMRRLKGSVCFGGKLAYCQQNAWIQNASLRDNVLFGQAWDEHRYWKAITDASLVADLEILPDGDLTEIGEKGINLSGGQKQRVNIARALYHDADIVLFDDPLSAVDAHVGKALFENAILGLKQQGRTVILVTHALHFLSMVDVVFAIQQGNIVERGTYNELMSSEGPFARLIASLGLSSKEEEQENEETIEEEAVVLDGQKPEVAAIPAKLTRKHMGKAAGTGKLEGRLMGSEVRKTGSIGGKVYGKYFQAGGAIWTGPLIIMSGVIMQVSQVLSAVWLTWWQDDHFNLSLGVYEGVYAALGLGQALFTFGLGGSLGLLAYLASNHLHHKALEHVFLSPMSLFDTQPLGRILGVFGKDIDTIDNQLAESLRLQAITLISLTGSAIIITVYFHYFILFFSSFLWIVPLTFNSVMFYQASSRELKRLDSLLRGLLYAHFSESLSGLATIRAYGEKARFIKDNTYYMDLEDRAYLLTTTNQRWLAVRLDLLGGCMVFAVGIMAAKGGAGLLPSQIALCLTYMTSLVQIFGQVVRQSAEVENHMNAVERVLFYSEPTSLPQEPPHLIPATQPADSWPEHGAIDFEDVVMSYRPGLPAVLKGISMSIREGEKVGIIGRTGAGKTSITVTLYRLVELTSGRIIIDGVDISKLGLNTLRSRIAIIPQDPVLFSGTLRSNLDPFDQHPDATLYDALRRACLIEDDAESMTEKTPGRTSQGRFTLDMPVEDEGMNLSVGERSLVSLARALVKNAQIVVLDEATAAVDLETDYKIQQTIHREFKGKTLLCIAHRLRTIISWDRILVMNAGQVEDFDTPLTLFDAGGMFRSMCERSGITREEIEKARAANA
ncbi:hypothetical protein TREMEDRAFT_44369 [Tremella mesenterica DSM 1558]|uniref:uncharacterized protein n=1 Tax=Tremella mesenterica (strain ATCC 24925 / CBS 8224 / DSM 1558 / NBRC 9311 / NRRL Y-6157 / RJB 2259-6 / UBC 559-6) TaxID=578456 RepID=UPI0003F4A36D|nr:uncharacterized protein TREMEDRAFT_44369 [Tremella mesenterica DSM 1558]EIW69200.1 hypothetical protein TREMEDRAFT_44369 [Tremella mesenterica DSM 1558]